MVGIWAQRVLQGLVMRSFGRLLGLYPGLFGRVLQRGVEAAV